MELGEDRLVRFMDRSMWNKRRLLLGAAGGSPKRAGSQAFSPPFSKVPFGGKQDVATSSLLGVICDRLSETAA
jgi:hypothetical protein